MSSKKEPATTPKKGSSFVHSVRSAVGNVVGFIRSTFRPTLSKTVKLFAALLVLAVMGALTAVMLRFLYPKSLIEVSAFEIFSSDSSKAKGGKAISDLAADKFRQIIGEANRFSGTAFTSKRVYGSVPDPPHIPVDTTYGIEVKGISVDQLLATWKHLRYQEYRVSGDLISKEGGDTIRLRYVTYGRANSFESDISKAGIDDGLKQIALRTVEEINPEVAARYLLQERVVCTPNCPAASENAKSFLWRWVQQEPANAKSSYFLAYALALDKNDDDALAFLDRSMQLDKQFFPAMNMKGVLLTRHGHFPDAEATFQDALRIRNNPTAMQNLGIVKQLDGKYGEAETWFRKAIDQEPSFIGALSALGNLLMFTSRNAEAADVFRDALKFEPGRSGPLSGLTLALARDGKFDEALHNCDRVLNLDPGRVDAMTDKAMMLVYMKKPDEAITQSRAAIAKRENPDAHYQLIMAYIEKRDLGTAQKEILGMLDSYPSDVDMVYVMAKLLEAEGDPKSKAYFDKVESLSRGYAFYQADALEVSFVFSQLKNEPK
ncbi:MAG TPA: tetratricopeptide repeat protein [Candidatus Angelobacter sp.]|jgi:tetratricopeptide (TPR) repeat protein|nr:tetratricopeptide repeat protein [Candidatus Angelobacter sp.]